MANGARPERPARLRAGRTRLRLAPRVLPKENQVRWLMPLPSVQTGRAQEVAMKRFAIALVIGVGLVAGLACGLRARPPAEQTPSVTLVPQATATEARPLPTAIHLPSGTTSPTALNAHGPHVLFEGSEGIWISNPDGSYLTRLANNGIWYADLHRALSPRGDALAYVGLSDEGPTLELLRIPSGKQETLTLLQSITQDELLQDQTGARALAYHTITMYDNVAWQPGDGELIAFVAARDGSTADLYTYDLKTGEIKQLTDGSSHAVFPTWSPDGRYVLHFGGSWVPPFGGAILGYNRLDGAWAVRVDDGAIITQPKPKGFHGDFVDWVDDAHYLISDADPDCIYRNLHSVDVESLQMNTVFEPCFYAQARRAPGTGAILFSTEADCGGCTLGEGTFLLLPSESAPRRVLDRSAVQLSWLPESDVFNAYPEALVSADGTRRYDPPVYDRSYLPAVSRRGYVAWEVIDHQQASVMVQVPGGEFRTILEAMVDQLIWDPQTGNTLLIAAQDGTLYAASFPDFAPREVGNLGGRVNQAIWTP